MTTTDGGSCGNKAFDGTGQKEALESFIKIEQQEKAQYPQLAEVVNDTALVASLERQESLNQIFARTSKRFTLALIALVILAYIVLIVCLFASGLLMELVEKSHWSLLFLSALVLAPSTICIAVLVAVFKIKNPPAAMQTPPVLDLCKHILQFQQKEKD